MRLRLGVLALIAAGAVVVGLTVPAASASHASKARRAAGVKGPCYPISVASPTFGSFSVSSTVKVSPTSAEVDSGGNFPHALIETTALTSFSFRGSESGSTISAALDYLRIAWGPGVGGVTHFTAKCVQELSVDSSGSDRSFEAELEGSVDYLPGVAAGPVDVIASISVSKDGSNFSHKVTLEEGVTCAEGHDIGGSPNFGFPFEPESSSSSKDFAVGSFSAPYSTSVGAFNWTGTCADGSIFD